MQAFVDLLINRSRANVVDVDAALDDALIRLDALLADIAGQLTVEYYGPAVGIDAGRDVYKLVVRQHEWRIHEKTWSAKVCTALPHAQWRADWAMQGTGRLRKQLIVKALPAFFSGYAAAAVAAGKSETIAGRRLAELAALFAPK